MHRLRHIILLTLLTLLLPPVDAYADGVIIDPPRPCPVEGPCPPWPCLVEGPCPPRPLFPLAIQYHRVTVSIDNQVATTKVDQLFRNDNTTTVEGTYLFPIPIEAAVSDFAMWVDGRRVEGKLLSAAEARQVYDEIVRQTRDPALLEYAGRGAVQASLFPVPPGETRRVELEYAQVLAADNGLIHYRYPLNTEKFSSRPLEQVSVSVKVISPDAVRAIYSPTHDIAIARAGSYQFSAGYEANDVTPNTDFDLYYSVSPADVGVNLVTYRDPASGEGFFMLLAAPSLDVDSARTIAKDVIVVLDQSGSMDGEKFSQAQGALQYVLSHLNAEDRFSVIAFSTGTHAFARDLRPASEATQASRWVGALRADGGTNINLALLEAMASVPSDSARPAIVIFLTDGLATEGEVETEKILANVAQSAPQNVRLFAFGVGDDVDTILLDTLVEQQHGTSSYVRPGQRIDEAVSGFFAKVSTPVLSNLSLDFGSAEVEDVYPDPLPDMFAGGQLIVTGHYRGSGNTTLSLTGQVNGQTRTFTYPDQRMRESGGSDFIPRLWATRRIGYLLNQVRLHGENKELIDSIVKLSIRYGIVTPYTSYLVTENQASVLTDEGRGALADQVFAAAAAATQVVSGASAVDKAADQSALAVAASPAQVQGEAANVVKIVGDRTFLLSDGAWIETGFDPSRMQAAPVSFASDAYFALVSARPELAGPFALGAHVIALDAGGAAYEVIPGDAPALVIPPTYTPQPTGIAVAQGTPAPTTVVSTPGAVMTQAPTGQRTTPPEAQTTLVVGALIAGAAVALAGWVALRKK